jgi:MFS family permease
MVVPMMLKEFGSLYPTAEMTIGQALEVLAMLFLSLVAGRFRIRWFLIVGMLFGVLRFALFALAGECGVLAVIWLGVALQGPIYTFTMVAGRLFLDKRVPDTMRGQAQALHQLLVGSIAGIIGAFFCGWLYQANIVAGKVQWVWYWLILTVMALVPLVYFTVGITGKSSGEDQ